MPYRFLILNPVEGECSPLVQALSTICPPPHQIVEAPSLSTLIEELNRVPDWDVVIADFITGDGHITGKPLFQTLRASCRDTPLVAVASKGDVEIAASAIEAGANDFMVRQGHLEDRVSTLLEKLEPHFLLRQRNRVLHTRNQLLVEAAGSQHALIGNSPQIREVFHQVQRVAPIPRPILITGERGTGKELVARAIHDAGGAPDRPMISVNCAAFSDHLLESELFGHEKGSFTGADRQVLGKFEMASDGTLFLDEIGNMSLAFQQKILRVVEYGVFTRVGGTREIKVQTRIIAATNIDLAKQMDEGLFLRDLYNRLSFDVVRTPPLRERTGDIALLSRYFLQQFMQEIPSFQGKTLSREALRILEDYPFPGNIRELKNIIERAAYRDTTNEITATDIGILSPETHSWKSGTFPERVEGFKRQLVLEALQETNGNQAQAARKLGLSYHQYRYFLKKYQSG